MIQLPKHRTRTQIKVMVLTLKFCVRSISLEPFGQFSLNSKHMFLSVGLCAVPLTRLHRLKVKVSLQSHVIYPFVCVHSISHEPFERFSLISCPSNLTNRLLDFHWHHSNVPLFELVYRTHDSAMQTQSQGHTSKSWDFAVGDMAVLQTAVLFQLYAWIFNQRWTQD